MGLSKLQKKRIYWLALAWSIICGLLLTQLLITEGLRPEFFTRAQIFGYPILRLGLGLFLILFLVLPVYHFLQAKPIFIRIIGFTLSGLVYSLLYVCLGILILQMLQGPFNMEASLNASIEDLLTNLHHLITYYLMLLAILLAIDYLREKVEAVNSRKLMEQQLAETRLHVLKSQLHPHFLFNALNSVTAIMEYQPEIAQDMLVDISTLLRTSLRIDYAQLIPLEKEMELLQIYLDIEKRRFEHQLDIQVITDEAAAQQLVPPFILQPLAENAIKHGYREGIRNLCLEIRVSSDKHSTTIRIANNGAELQTTNARIGLSSIRERLKNAFGDQVKFSLVQQDNWVVNTIEIPQTCN